MPGEIKNWAPKGMPPHNVNVYAEYTLYETPQPCCEEDVLRIVKSYIEGAFPYLGAVHQNGLHGIETIVVREFYHGMVKLLKSPDQYAINAEIEAGIRSNH